MTQKTRETLLTLGYIFAGLAGSAASGYLLAPELLSRHPALLVSFLVVGFAGALIYASARLRSLGFALMMIILLFLSQVALRPPLRAASAINAAIRALPIGIAFCASAYIFKALKKVPFGKFLIMALLVGLGHGLVVVLSSIRFHQPVALRVVCAMGCEGLLLGGLMGAGFELIDLAAKERKTVEPGLP